MQSITIFVAVVALLAFASVHAQNPTNCNEVEFDAFDIGSTGTSIGEVYHRVYQGTPAGEGAILSGSLTFITLTQAITNGLIQFDILLSPFQGSATNSSNQIQNYPLNPDNITLTLNGGTPQNQIYNPSGNNFTFNNFLGNGSVSISNLLTVFVIQNATTIVSGTGVCTSLYAFNITNPSNVSIKGDPQFMGLRGQSYQIHGIDGAVYNIISDNENQLNSRFTFLTGPRPCPNMPSTSRKSTACWAHPGSYLGEIGLKAGKEQIFVASGPAATGFSAVTVNGKQLSVGASTSFIQFNSTHEITLTFGAWTIELENSDMFINLRSVRVASSGWSSLNSHGLLGQTWANKRYNGKVAAIEGEVDDYMVGENSVFGDSFVFNRYQIA